MKVKIFSQDGKAKGDHDFNLREDLEGVSQQVVHDVVVAHRAAQRSGTANTKTVAEVSGSGKKPWRQKGTGRARAGQARSPVWRKGGVVFGPRPRDYTKKVSKNVRKLAFDKALSSRIQSGDVVVLEKLDVSGPKTSEFVGILKGLNVQGRTLLIHDSISPNLIKASRNVEWVNTVSSDSVNTYQILDCRKIVLTKPALEKLTTRNASRK